MMTLAINLLMGVALVTKYTINFCQRRTVLVFHMHLTVKGILPVDKTERFSFKSVHADWFNLHSAWFYGTDLMQRRTCKCEWQRLQETFTSASKSIHKLASTRQNYADLWHAHFINSSTSSYYFNTSFMRLLFSRCHAHF